MLLSRSGENGLLLAGPLFVAVCLACPCGVATALPQEAVVADEDPSATTRVWELGGVFGVAFADVEGITTGPVFGLSVGRWVNESWVIEGQFRTWIGRGNDPGFGNQQWMGMFRALYVHQHGRLRPLVGLGAGWDHVTWSSPGLPTIRDGSLFGLITGGLEARVGRLAVRPEFGLQLGPSWLAPQLTLGLVYRFGG